MNRSRDLQVARAAAHDPSAPDSAAELVVIRPSHGWVPINVREVWAYRELVYFLVWADVKIRYKQTVLGAAWAIIQPFFTMVVFSIFFGRLAGVPSEGVPYPVFAYVALVPWSYFANALALSSNSLLQRQGLITKVYFPRLVVPLASVVSGLIDFAIAFSVLLLMLLVYGIVPTLAILTLPLFVLFAAVTAFGTSLWLSALNVQYRDIRHVVPFLIQIWLFASPVAYPSSLVPSEWRGLFGLNPMAGVVEGFRWALLGQGDPPGALLAVSVLVVAFIVVSGLFYFRRMEKSFVDVV